MIAIKNLIIILLVGMTFLGCSHFNKSRGLASQESAQEYYCVINVNGDILRSAVFLEGENVSDTLDYDAKIRFPRLEDSVVFGLRSMVHEIDGQSDHYLTLVKIVNDEVVTSVPVVGAEIAALEDKLFWTDIKCKRR